ncbi:MAG: hypothetical protein H0V53_06565 [Rubrobacter sp.]|nr:hypothetical protein [Rubrobacter sp.]
MLAESPGPPATSSPGRSPRAAAPWRSRCPAADRLRMELGGPGELPPAVLEEHATTPYLAT